MKGSIFCSTAYLRSRLPMQSLNTLRIASSVSQIIFGRKSPAYPLCRYNRAYKTHYARCPKKKTTAQFELWSRYAVELRQKAENGEIELSDYQRELRV